MCLLPDQISRYVFTSRSNFHMRIILFRKNCSGGISFPAILIHPEHFFNGINFPWQGLHTERLGHVYGRFGYVGKMTQDVGKARLMHLTRHSESIGKMRCRQSEKNPNRGVDHTCWVYRLVMYLLSVPALNTVLHYNVVTQLKYAME